ncbi:Uncharacterised protein [Mycobacteroides abscessus]|nr:Uncharacterised protein [Mycobacteroides abscessus]CPS62275.1 Uncharacterised protein [Mycobacteroides abscessus]CPY44609.1 Uncharacterised protein [Mycobacteroides abscessus]CPY52420.1 Uncharacterised protein [Mycobacteroides abscessus]SLI81158.1 Uncharacterised protein [Mycobacteroides abscessus subsp. abscessus]
MTSPGGESQGRDSTQRRRRNPPTGTKPSETAGGELERRVARVEFAEGSFVRLRVPVPADTSDSGRDILTDVDILSLDVDSRLRITKSSYECKSGKGQSGEPYTIVWLAGFRELLGLDRVSIVRQTVSTRGQRLAHQLRIVTIDDYSLRQREVSHSWLPDRFAHVDGEECIAAEIRTDTQLKGLSEIPLELTRFLRGHGALEESPALLSAVMTLGRCCERQGVLPDPAARVLAGHALIAIILAGLHDAGRLDQFGERELRGRLERALTLGDEENRYLIPLLERADALVHYVQERTHRAYIDAGAEPLRVPSPSLKEVVTSPPEFLNNYLDFVARLRANPIVAREMLQTAELACFDAMLGGHAWQSRAFEHLFTPEHRGLLLVALRCLRAVGGRLVAEPLQRIGDLPFRSGAGVLDRHSSSPPSNARTKLVDSEQEQLPIAEA